MKFRKVYMIGGDRKDPNLDDYVAQYVAENGIVIEVHHGFTNWSNVWYSVMGPEVKCFDHLSEAKAYIEQLQAEAERPLLDELRELSDQYSILDKSEENRARGERIREIRNTLGLIGKPDGRHDRRPSVIRWR